MSGVATGCGSLGALGVATAAGAGAALGGAAGGDSGAQATTPAKSQHVSRYVPAICSVCVALANAHRRHHIAGPLGAALENEAEIRR